MTGFEVVVAAVAAAATVGAAVMSAKAARQEGQRQQLVAEQNARADEFDATVALQNAQIAEENARLADQQAQAIERSGAIEVEQRELRKRQLIAAQRARLAAMGADPNAGSAYLLQAEEAMNAATDVALMRRQTDLDAGAARSQAGIDRRQANTFRQRSSFLLDQAGWQRETGVAAARAGGVLAGAQLLTGASNTATIVGNYAQRNAA